MIYKKGPNYDIKFLIALSKILSDDKLLCVNSNKISIVSRCGSHHKIHCFSSTFVKVPSSYYTLYNGIIRAERCMFYQNNKLTKDFNL